MICRGRYTASSMDVDTPNFSLFDGQGHGQSQPLLSACTAQNEASTGCSLLTDAESSFWRRLSESIGLKNENT